MIRLGLRLTLNGGRESLVRLAITAFAVALGVGMLLIALAGMNGLGAQNARAEWLNTVPLGSFGPNLSGPGTHRGTAGTASTGDAASVDPIWWLYSADQFGGQTIDRVDVATTGTNSPVLPGIVHLPGPGQFYASPALGALLRSTPDSELADRFPGTQVGTIGPSALPSPSSLIIVVGYSAASAVASSGRLGGNDNSEQCHEHGRPGGLHGW